MEKINKEIQFMLLGVKVESFSFSQINYPSDLGKEKEMNEKFNFTSKPEILQIIEHSIVRIIFNVRGFIVEGEKDYVNAIIIFDFHVTDLKNIVNKDGKGLDKDIHKPFLATIIGVCYSTTRGMLIEKLMGTNLSKFVLPIISPYLFLQPLTVQENPKKNVVNKVDKS